jgi:hydrogenase expression/formation protein HypC
MCLAIPGRVESMHEGAGGLSFGVVRFGTATREVCLAYVPEVKVGDYVLVHVGFAIQRVDEQLAEESLALLHEAAEKSAAEQIDTETDASDEGASEKGA